MESTVVCVVTFAGGLLPVMFQCFVLHSRLESTLLMLVLALVPVLDISHVHFHRVHGVHPSAASTRRWWVVVIVKTQVWRWIEFHSTWKLSSKWFLWLSWILLFAAASSGCTKRFPCFLVSISTLLKWEHFVNMFLIHLIWAVCIVVNMVTGSTCIPYIGINDDEQINIYAFIYRPRHSVFLQACCLSNPIKYSSFLYSDLLFSPVSYSSTVTTTKVLNLGMRSS